MSNQDKIRRQIEAILAKAREGSGATEDEAKSAAAKAHALMRKHGLSEADCVSRPRTAEQIAREMEYKRGHSNGSGRNLCAWEKSLAAAIEKLVGSVGVYQNSIDGRGAFTFYGPADDVEIARMLFDEWRDTIGNAARSQYGGSLRGPGRAYGMGFARSLWEKAKALAEADGAGQRRLSAADMAAASQPGACTALVVAAQNALVIAKRAEGVGWLKRQGVNLTSASAKARYSDRSAYGHGRSDGFRANLSRNQTLRLG